MALARVQARRGRLGSIDLQTGTAALGTQLATEGLRLALDRKSAALVFAWLERSRAQAFRVRPVRPPADPQAAAVLAELRQLSRLIRAAELKGTRDPPMIARRAELQREMRQHDWQASGLGKATSMRRRAPPLRDHGRTGGRRNRFAPGVTAAPWPAHCCRALTRSPAPAGGPGLGGHRPFGEPGARGGRVVERAQHQPTVVGP